MGLTLLTSVSLPIKLWAKAFITATHIIKFLPTIVLNNKNPYEMLFRLNLITINSKCFVVLVIICYALIINTN